MSLASSFSMLRHRAVASAVPLLLRRFRSLPIAARQQQNPNKQAAPSRNLLKAKKTLKEFSSLAPVLSLEDSPPLTESQAIGVVAASQANFMRVIVPESDQPPSSSGSFRGVELLCVVRALLKKIKRRVMVGDKVLVGSVDWVDRRGWIENVFHRSSEILDPPVANVDHLLVLFSLEQPRPEPFTLTRFLVEAESTGIPLTLALNKTELVDKEVRFTRYALSLFVLPS